MASEIWRIANLRPVGERIGDFALMQITDDENGVYRYLSGPAEIAWERSVMVSVLHIGLPLGPPWLTQEDGEKIAARLAGIRQRMEAAGFRYDVLHASPDTGLTEFRERLRAERVDAVLLGGGVAGDPKLASFKWEIIGAAREVAPQAKVLEFDHALEVPVLVRRAFEML